MKKTLSTQVFIDIRPVDRESAAGYAPVGALLRRRRQKARIPRQRHRDGAAVQEIDDQDVFGKSDVPHTLARAARGVRQRVSRRGLATMKARHITYLALPADVASWTSSNLPVLTS